MSGKLLHDIRIVYTLVILSVFVIQVKQVNSLTRKALTVHAPRINLGHGGVPIVSLSTDRYDSDSCLEGKK